MWWYRKKKKFSNENVLCYYPKGVLTNERQNKLIVQHMFAMLLVYNKIIWAIPWNLLKYNLICIVQNSLIIIF